MTAEWSDRRPAGWPSEQPVWAITALVLAAAMIPALLFYQYRQEWTALQRYYLGAFVRSQAYASGLFSSPLLAWKARAGSSYLLLDVIDRKGQRPAMDFDVEPVEVAGPNGRPETSYTLSAQGVAAGDKRLVWYPMRADHAKLHQFLQHWIYADHSLWDLASTACWSGLGVLIMGLVAAIPLERKRSLLRRRGQRERGPEILTRDQFNRKCKGDGIGFVTKERQSVRERLFVRYAHAPMVLIPRRDLSNHFLILGDSGTGKSALIRQMLTQIQDSGETAIVYDPALEYTPQFYSPERGDQILNPLDERTPYWTPGDEIKHHAEALGLASSLFPERHEENRFFVDSPRKIFAHLLTYRPTPQELTRWMCQPEEIDKRVAGTELASLIDPHAPAQRSGVLGSLNLVADAFRLLPEESAGRNKWSAAEWSQQRKGWLFLTSTPQMRERLRPLITANRLAHEVLGRSLDDLPPQTRRLLLLLDQMTSEECRRLKMERKDYRFSRRDVRRYTEWGDTQLRVHLQRLEDLEYLLAHRGGRGQSFVYELMFERSAQDDKPVLAGLIDPGKLAAHVYEEKNAGPKDQFAGPARGQNGGVAGSARPAQKPITTGFLNGLPSVPVRIADSGGDHEASSETITAGSI
jgi:hypothetical protein